MEETENYKQFSFNLFYIKKDNNRTIYNNKKIRLGTFTQDFNERDKVLLLSNYSFEKRIIDCMHELLFFQIFIAIIIQVDKLIIEGFPLTARLIRPVISACKQKYGEEKIKIERFEEDSLNEECNLVIIINQPKRTHYIQQAYLRNFASNSAEWINQRKKHKARIFVYDKILGATINIGNSPSENNFGQKINNIAKKDFFYSLALEDFMAKTLERKIPQIFKKLISDKSTRSLTIAQNETLVKYILLTWSRTPEAREHFREGFEKGTEMGIKYLSEFDLPENHKVVIKNNFLRFQHESYIINLIDPPDDNDGLFKHLLSFNFGVKEAKNSSYFVTSDNPIVFYNSYYEFQKKKGNDFIKKRRQEALAKMKKDKRVASVLISTLGRPERAPGVKGVEIYFPITPKICLFLIDKQNGSKLLSTKNIITETILQANQFIYSHKADINFIKKVIKENPQCNIRKENRVKIKGLKVNPKGTGEPKLKALRIDDILKKDDFLQ